MRKIFIGEEREYARRLTNYLLGHLPADIQLQSFTGPEILVQAEERADLYLLGVDFYEKMTRLQPDYSEREILLIGDGKAEGEFSRLEPPDRLVKLICNHLAAGAAPGSNHFDSCRLIAVYAPFPDISLRRWIWQEMEPGDVYLGLQDIGAAVETMSREKKEKKGFPVGIMNLPGKETVDDMEISHFDMGSLCYYIHLHEEEIMDKMKKMLHREDGRYFLDSPSWYFDFLGLREEDYRWFFSTIKECPHYTKVFVGLGNNAVPSLEYFSIFDHVILLDFPEREKIHKFCARFASTVVDEGYLPESSLEVRDCSGQEKKAGGWEESFEAGGSF